MISIACRSAAWVAWIAVGAAAGPILDPSLPQASTSRDVSFPGGAEGVTLAGTLLLPEGATSEARVPAVVLVTGSGAQDRDETISGRKPFRVLAEALAREGFAVLRYDDRGTEALKLGRSTGTFSGATLRETSEDAAAAIAFVATQAEIDPARIVICGHSTGGLEAAMLLGAGRVPAGAILLATPAVPGALILADQSAAILRASHAAGRVPITAEKVEQSIEVQSALIHAAAGEDAAARDRAAADAVAFFLTIRSPELPLTEEVIQTGSAQALAPLKEPWMAQFLRYDPAKDLASSKVPVLMVFGGRDLQVAPALSAQPATEALSKSNQPQSMVVTLPTSNHLFQQANTGLTDEYGELTDEMGPALTSVVTEWLDLILSEKPAAADDAAAPAGAAGEAPAR